MRFEIGFEAGFVAGYALLLLAVAAGIHRLGKNDTNPWTSRMLAGHRRQVGEPPQMIDSTDWPHSEAGRLHTLVALVTSAAGLTLCVVELIRNHRPAEILLLGVLIVPTVFALTRLAGAFAHRGRSKAAHEPPVTS